MTKPRIIILMHYLELGGAEMALIGLLHALDPARVNVDLFVYSHQGPLMKYIPDWVNLLPELRPYAMIEQPMSTVLYNRQLGVAIARVIAKTYHKFKHRVIPTNCDDYSMFQYIGNYVSLFLPRINPTVEYDLCISFLAPHNIGRDKVNAKKKLAWIHTDYSKAVVDTKCEFPVWEAYDNIVSISADVRQAFETNFPGLQSKIIDIENILPIEYVKIRANEKIESPIFDITDKINLLSIGRFAFQKNFDNIPYIAQILVDTGFCDFRWYIIGYGADEALIRQKIKETRMEEHVIMLGKQDNPYPYIKACDIYVQPSRYEGKSVTVREAQILCKPVAITAYPTAGSQVRDGLDGVIVPMDNEGCARGLAKLINDREKQESLAKYCSNHDFANRSEVDKIYSLLK